MSRKLGLAPLIGLVFAVLITLTGCGNVHLGKTDATATPAATASPTSSATATCPTTWPMVPADHRNFRWFADGIAEIRAAKTSADARKAIGVWLDKVKADPSLLSGAAQSFMSKTVNPTTLVDKGCATQPAVNLTIELATDLGRSSVSVSQAPTNGYNSGVDNGRVVSATQPGISGDRKAVLVTTKDGKKVWVMARCGNPVTTGKPNLPTGNTDQPKPTSTPTSTPTPTSTTPKPGCKWPLTNGRCLQPKSSNPKDYIHITGAPKATVNSGPTTPSPVITSQTGGGGVIDSPTRAPGSTSGVVAPGATPAPTTPRDTPPPESGAQPPSTGSTCVPAPGQTTC